LREALANAVAHRDYSRFVRNDKISVAMFADRLEIRSPGGLFGRVTVDNIEEEDSTRNACLMTLLEDTGLVENRGSGIDAMIASLRKANMAPPTFSDQRVSFVVSFNNHTLLGPGTLQWLNQFSHLSLNDRQRTALAFLKSNEKLTNSVYRRLNHVDALLAGQEIRGLVHENLVEQHGGKRGTFYRLAVSAELPPGPAPVTDEGRILQFVKEHGSINNEQCRELLNITDEQARYLLSGRLVATGQLHAVGTRRWRRYELP